MTSQRRWRKLSEGGHQTLDEDMPTHHMMEHDEYSPCKTSEHKHYTPTRCSAKRKQEQVNLFQTKLEIEIFKDVILSYIFYLYLDKVYTRRSYCCTKREKIVLHRSWTNTPSSWQQKRRVQCRNGPVQAIFITFDFQMIWRPIRTFWKAHQVFFPMPQVSSHLDITIKSYVWISQDCWEG